jgi:hypothetical protein
MIVFVWTFWFVWFENNEFNTFILAKLNM